MTTNEMRIAVIAFVLSSAPTRGPTDSALIDASPDSPAASA